MIRGDIVGLEQGRSTEAQNFLRTCCHFLERGEVPPQPAAQHLAQLLAAICEHETPWGVPLLKRKRGQKSADDYHANWGIAHWYWQLTTKKGYKAAAARLEMVQRSGFLSNDDIMNIWRRFKAEFKGRR